MSTTFTDLPIFGWRQPAVVGLLGDYTFAFGPLAVILDSLEAVQQSDQLLVAWETVSEIDNRGFNLYRGLSSDGPDRRLNAT